MTTDPAGKDPPAPPPPPWPKVIGTIGAVLGVIMVVDKTDDLALIPLMWAEDSRRFLLGPELSEAVAGSMPRAIWPFLYLLLGGLLGLLLVVGSLRLRRRRRSGVALCRAWAWLSIAWLAIGAAGALWWLARYSDEISRHAGPGWDRGALSGALVALLMLAYPVFLLVWLSRAPVKAEYQSWRD